MVDAVVLDRSTLQQGHREANALLVFGIDNGAVHRTEGAEGTANTSTNQPLDREDVQLAATGSREQVVFLDVLQDGPQGPSDRPLASRRGCGMAMWPTFSARNSQ